VFGNKSLISSHSKTIRSPAPSSLPAKNSNCLLLIITIPDRTWIACRNKHMAPAIIAAGPPSRFPHWDCGMSRCDLRAALGWPPQPTRYLLDHALCVQPRRRRSAFVDRGNTRWDFLGVYPHRLQSILCYAGNPEDCFLSGIKGVHETGRGRWQYDVEMAEQWGVFAFAREGRACAPLLDLTHLWWTAAASSTGVQRLVVHMQRRWLRRGKMMASNFSILHRRL
jgi:hypothetical protein